MRGLRKIVVAALVVALAIGIAVMGASELGGEVVTLHTASPDGEVTTRIWIVDEAGYAWLRAGVPENGWLLRIDADPEVVIERGGESLRFRAVPVRNDPALRDVVAPTAAPPALHLSSWCPRSAPSRQMPGRR